LVAFSFISPPFVDSASRPLLDALDHFLHHVLCDPAFERVFYAATTPEEMVAMAVENGILIEADDFRALLRGGSTEFWITSGDSRNPITHLQRVFSV
jgi:hypothetical protein